MCMASFSTGTNSFQNHGHYDVRLVSINFYPAIQYDVGKTHVPSSPLLTTSQPLPATCSPFSEDFSLAFGFVSSRSSVFSSTHWLLFSLPLHPTIRNYFTERIGFPNWQLRAKQQTLLPRIFMSFLSLWNIRFSSGKCKTLYPLGQSEEEDFLK